MMRYCLLLAAALCVMNVQAADLPPAFRADYIIKKGPFELGRSSRELSYGDNGELVFRTDSQSAGLVSLFYSEQISETTRMQQADGRVVPIETAASAPKSAAIKVALPLKASCTVS